MSTSEYPRDVRIRGVEPAQLTDIEFKGPTSLAIPEQWPEQMDIYETQ